MSAKSALRGLPSDFADRPITGADLRGLIDREQVLGINYRAVVPGPAALQDLAMAVSVLRGRVRIGTDADLTSKQLLNDERKKIASKALEMLASVLPALREDILAAPECGPSDISHFMRLMSLSQLDALKNTVAEAWEYGWLTPHQELSAQVSVGADWAVQHSDAYAVPAPPQDREIHKWHNFAAFLADKFRDVMQASNPSLPRLANGGASPNAVMRFLAAIIPHITGEEPDPGAVRKWLKDHPTGDKST
jgi:hypothetical protein